ncbi:CYTH domain-containing protein [Rhizobium sp. SSA_523]|uniref:CYTH domain-containing protein n=1 Tax=Rhizobium sp. SSA_523 TaxID=2952477 RepID=UPI002090FFAD|nr:CYTH domain-containing protein [Rhizobium sp. SSA_523]MCO5731824.1 CYTH domain-containing protein [Rhizobium sp. SSA_523]WKC22812.1 CYTH domain-containing protein [Rhizobium sp. SSA_523]
MAKEIERKFLVRSDGWTSHVTSSAKLRQGYVTIGEDRSLRIRLRDQSKALLTIKIGRDLLSRDEYEYEIPLADGEELIRASIGTIIEKTRHNVPVDGLVWEIDVFHGAYEGLVLAEVELTHEGQQPSIPSWIGAEVTGDRRYSNMAMATETASKEIVNGLSHPAV